MKFLERTFILISIILIISLISNVETITTESVPVDSATTNSNTSTAVTTPKVTTAKVTTAGSTAAVSTATKVSPTTPSTATPTTTVVTTTVRPTLSQSSVLSTFWCTIGVEEEDTRLSVNTTAYRNNIEDKLLEAYKEAVRVNTQNKNAGKRRRKRAASSADITVQVISVNRVGDTKQVNVVFLVQQGGKYVAASTVVSMLRLISDKKLSIILGKPVTSAPKVYESNTITNVDSRVWIIGAVLGTLGAIVVIVWLVLFIYARCLRPQPPTLLDAETPRDTEFKSPLDTQDGYTNVTYQTQYSENGMAGVGAPVAATPRDKPVVRVEDESNNLDINLLADEVVRRLDKKVSRIVDRKLDSRTESMREPDGRKRATLLSPSEEDSYVEDRYDVGQLAAPPKKARQRRKSKINSISPSEDDSLSLPPLHRPRRSGQLSEEDEEEERRRRRKARQRVARDLDRALGTEDNEPGTHKKKSKSKSGGKSRRQQRRSVEENDETLEVAREKMTELLSQPYPVTGSSQGDTIEAQSTGTLHAANPSRMDHPDGELLKPTPVQPDPGHRPIHVMTSLRPDALSTAALTSTYKTGDEMEKIRPQAEKDLQSHPNAVLDVRGATPVYVRSPPPGSSDNRATPVGAFRPVAPASSAQPPGAPLPGDADETDVAAGAAASASPKPLIDSIREELKRLATKSEA